jgi:tight adherence protein B
VHADGGVPAWAELVARCGGDREVSVALLAAGRLAARTGAPLADVLDRVGGAMARDAEAAGQRTAALAGPRATARVLAWLPASGVLLGFALGADPAAVLLDGGAGTMLLVLGALLTAAGQVWSRRCVRAALRAAGAEP